MASNTVLKKWREVYFTCFQDGPDNELKPKAARPDKHSIVLLFENVVATRSLKGIETAKRTLDSVELAGDTPGELAEKLDAFLSADDVRMFADRVKNVRDVQRQEPLTPELLDGTADIYQSKEALIG